MKLLIANWKAAITVPDAMKWLHTFLDLAQTTELEAKLEASDVHLIICPPFPLVPVVKEHLLLYKNINVGSQTVSSMQNGAYTGEVTADLLKEYAHYSIIGHSERRQFFHVNEEEIAKQINECLTHTITPILCVRGENDRYYDNVNIIAYEPVEAIGSGQNAEVTHILEMKKRLNLKEGTLFIYGGSVDETNIGEYLQTGEIDGFLVGTASLNAESFFKMAEQMA